MCITGIQTCIYMCITSFCFMAQYSKTTVELLKFCRDNDPIPPGEEKKEHANTMKCLRRKLFPEN